MFSVLTAMCFFYPRANVKMEMDGLQVKVEAAGSERIRVVLLLGKDVPEFNQLLVSMEPRLVVEEFPGGSCSTVVSYV